MTFQVPTWVANASSVARPTIDYKRVWLMHCRGPSLARTVDRVDRPGGGGWKSL